jgi:hypothetical protein
MKFFIGGFPVIFETYLPAAKSSKTNPFSQSKSPSPHHIPCHIG